MRKPSLYWHIQHLDQIGGTEMVSTDLMNHLSSYFDITCIVTAKIINDPVYKLNPSIKVFCLDIPQEVTRLDAYCLQNMKNKKGYKNVILYLRAFRYFVLKKRHYRDVIEQLIASNPGKLISSSADSYMFAPYNVYSIFHFHFNTKNYFTFSNKLLLKLSRKPDEVVFLTKSTMDLVANKLHLTYRSSFIYNPIRIEPKLLLETHNNHIAFMGRLSEQKNPLFALQIAKTLKERGFSFTLSIAGNGPLEDTMKKYIQDNNLSDCVEMVGLVTDVETFFAKCDLLLITSKYEGFVLVKGEANACSVPCVSTYFGDSTEEMFEMGKDGIYITSKDPNDYADQIIRILNDTELLLNMKHQSFISARSLGYNKIIPQWIELLTNN